MAIQSKAPTRKRVNDQEPGNQEIFPYNYVHKCTIASIHGTAYPTMLPQYPTVEKYSLIKSFSPTTYRTQATISTTETIK